MIQNEQYTVPIAKAVEFQKCYDGTQYDDLLAWSDERDSEKKYVPLRRRKPSVRANLGKALCNRVKAFVMGAGSFPQISIGEEEMQAACTWVAENKLKRVVPSALLKACVQGSVGITFGMVRGILILRSYARDIGWPLYDDAGELAGLVIRYAGYHPTTGVACWFRGRFDSVEEVWETGPASTGPWTAWRRNEHNLGFVPAIWQRHMNEGNDSPDGVSLLDGLLDTLREYDYCLSRTERMLTYTADPQPVVSDENPQDTAQKLVKGPHGVWCIGKDGKVFYLEINGKGVELQMEFGKTLRNTILELARVVISDPDKVSGGAMSGYALRMAHEVMIDLAEDLRLGWDSGLQELMCKILAAASIYKKRGWSVHVPTFEANLFQRGWWWAVDTMKRLLAVVKKDDKKRETVERFHPWMDGTWNWPVPESVTGAWPITLAWGEYFDPSPDEEKTKVEATTLAVSGNLIQRSTGTKALAGMFGVADVESEVAGVEAAAGVDLIGR